MTGGDRNHILLIFDSIQEEVTIRFCQLKLEILESPNAETPLEEHFAFTNCGISRDYVAMGVGRRGIPTSNRNGSMDFVTDYPCEPDFGDDCSLSHKRTTIFGKSFHW